MIILIASLHHFSAGTYGSRRRSPFIPVPASAATTSRSGSGSGRQVRQRRPIRNHRDPQSIKMPATIRLAGADLKEFEAHRAMVENRLITLRHDLIAGAACRAES